MVITGFVEDRFSFAIGDFNWSFFLIDTRASGPAYGYVTMIVAWAGYGLRADKLR